MPHAPPAKVFIIDDDPAVRDSLGLLLEIHGLAVATYGSTDAFIKEYRCPPHGCLILDQHLADTTGLDFLESATGKSLGIPVILITGRGDDSLKARALRSAAAYFEKPLQEDALVATVARLMSGGHPLT